MIDSLWEDEDEELFSQFQATQKVPDRDAKALATPGTARNESQKEWGRLILATGENTNPGLESVYELCAANGFTIGRGRNSTLTIQDPTISHKHCKIYHKDGKCYVVDFGSSNGTFLNGNPDKLAKDSPVELYSGDIISLVYKTKKDSLTSEAGNSKKHYYEFVFKSLLPTVGVRASKTCQEVDSKYEVYEVLGNGSYATVRRAIHRESRQEFAIKIVEKKQFSYNNPSRWQDQINEAKMLEKLNHPNIVKLREMILTEHALYMVLEFVRGGELFDRLSEGGPYSEAKACQLMYNILLAVAYLHNLGIVHRDLKPENILLVSKDSEVDIKLADFGVAKEERGGRGTFCGSMSYIAPEVLQRRDTVMGRGKYGKGADMWSLGVIAYIVLTCCPPFEEESNIPLQEQVKRVIKFAQREWKDKSMMCKDLVAGLLTVDERTRLTAQQALKHPWFNEIRRTKKAAFPPPPSMVAHISSLGELSLTGSTKRKHSQEVGNELRVITNINEKQRQEKKHKREAPPLAASNTLMSS